MINFRVAENAALRVVGYGVSDGGYIDDSGRGLEDINRTRIYGGRVTFRVEAGDGWTVDLGLTGQAIEGADSQYADRGEPPLNHESRFAQGFEARYGLADLVIAKEWDGLRLLSSTGVAGQRLTDRPPLRRSALAAGTVFRENARPIDSRIVKHHAAFDL